MARKESFKEIVTKVTQTYLSQIDPKCPPPLSTIEGDLIEMTRTELMLFNEKIPKGLGYARYSLPTTLYPQQVAEVMIYLYHIVKIPPAEEVNDSAYDLVAMYQTSGSNKGIYVVSEEEIRGIARKLKYGLTKKDFDEVMLALRDLVPRKTQCKNPNLIPVNNGIFDYETKTLMPFSPEYVFLSKCHVDYNPNATNVTIHNDKDGTDWDVEGWFSSLSDDVGVQLLLWQIAGACLRPYVNWSKCAWLYSTVGNNGKGTFCELLRQLVGHGSYASIPLADMGKEFALEPLISTHAIIVDENDVGTFIDRAANLKALVTHDVIQINRKFKQMIPFKFYGFIVQCLNEMPRVKDKSDSFYRRQIFIPFEKCFTGMERKYIKTDYLHRPEVLEYVLKKVLEMTYDELTVPASCEAALEEYKTFNDPVLQFIEEILPLCVWDLLPFGFLYDLYRAWYKDAVGEGGSLGRNKFIQELVTKLGDDNDWYCPGRDTLTKTGSLIVEPEPLLQQFQLTKWMNPQYINRGPWESRCTPANLAGAYRGLLRKKD
jgi:putative DNA primase/helicase